jgi:TatD DNase family protein
VKDEVFDKEKYKELAQKKRVVAIGEIGLDNKYPNSNQKDIFIKQLDLAKELGLPVVIHCRMAHEDLINILKNYKLRGVVHCFSGTVEEMQEYLNLGFYIGFNGIIFKLPLDRAIKQCPLSKILLETDCPYLTPPKAKVERNEPAFAKYIVEHIAKLKGITPNGVASATTQNAGNLFKI